VRSGSVTPLRNRGEHFGDSSFRNDPSYDTEFAKEVTLRVQ